MTPLFLPPFVFTSFLFLSFSFFDPLDSSSSSSHLHILPVSPPQRNFSAADRRIPPPFTLGFLALSPHDTHPKVGTGTTRDSRLSTTLTRELTRDTNRPPLPFPLFNPLFHPRVPHRLFTRSRPGEQRWNTFRTRHSYNRLKHLTKGGRSGRRMETRAHTLRAYGRPSTNDLENFVVLGPLDRSGGDRDRSRSMIENCTSRTGYARNGKRTPRHRTPACLEQERSPRARSTPLFVEFERVVATTISARLKNDGIRPVIYPAHSDPQSRARASATPGPFPSCLRSCLSPFLPFLGQLSLPSSRARFRVAALVFVYSRLFPKSHFEIEPSRTIEEPPWSDANNGALFLFFLCIDLGFVKRNWLSFGKEEWKEDLYSSRGCVYYCKSSMERVK